MAVEIRGTRRVRATVTSLAQARSLGRPSDLTGTLLLAVAGSVVGTVFTSLAGSGQGGTVVGAAVLPVVAATFSTKQAGETGRVRMAAVVRLAVAALVITVTGFTLADGVAGKSVITGEQKGNLPRLPVPSTPPSPTPPRTASPTASPMASLQVKPTSVGCGTVAVGSTMPCPEKIEIEYTGAGLLHITSLELTGEQKDDFNASVSDQCWTLDPGETCPLNVTFHPETAGRRNATLVIHQTLPPPDTGTSHLLRPTN